MKNDIRNIVMMLCVCFVMLASTAKAASYAVPGDFGTIQEAINTVPDNSVIAVGAGIYTENLTISGKTNLTIKAVDGAASTTIDGSNKASVVVIDSTKTDNNLSVTIDGFTIKNGFTATDGGGVRVSGTSRVLVLNSHLVSNSATRGGAFSVADTASLLVYNSILDNNLANQQGGALYMAGGTTTLGHVTITRNRALEAGSIMQLFGATISGTNNIIYNNLDLNGIPNTPVLLNPATVDITYSDVEINLPGIGNLNIDPVFVDAVNGNYQLLARSPAINTGILTLTTDMLGVTRPQGNGIDMGAYEYTDIKPPVVISTIPQSGSMTVNPILTSYLYVSFDEPVIARDAITGVTINGIPISATVNGKQISLYRANLVLGVTYTVSIPAGAVTDTFGNPMEAYSFSFSTPTIIPAVVSTNPAHLATNIPAPGSLTVTFNENVTAGPGIIYDTTMEVRLTATFSGNIMTLTPPPMYPFRDGYVHNISIPPGAVKDANGTFMTAAYTFRFTTSDPNPPIITSTDPLNGATSVDPTTTSFSIYFNDYIITGSAINSITVNGQPLAASLNSTPNGLILSGANLMPGVLYTVSIPAGAVTDRAGNPAAAYSFSFRTTPIQDYIAPYVVSTIPIHSMTDVDPSTSLFYVNFNEAIVPGSTFNSMTLNNIPSLTPTISGSTLTLNFNTALVPGESYWVSLPAGAVTDVAGNAIIDYAFLFTTTPPADTIAPKVVSTNPANKAKGVSTGSSITITFSENVSAASAFSNISLKVNKTSVGITRSLNGNKLTITPQTGLKKGTTYSVTIPTRAVADVAGNTNKEYSFSFTTR